MFKKYNNSIIAGVVGTLICYGGLVSASMEQGSNMKSAQVAAVTPATVTPPTVTPATVTPTTITPPVVTPNTITPPTITPPITTPSNTTPSITTPANINPARVNPGNSSSATSTSMTIPNTTASDADSKIKTVLPVGMIVNLSGTANALKENKKIHHLKEKSLFFAHDIIYTKNDSKVALRFNDGTFLVLGPDSALEIKEYRFTVPAKGSTYFGSSKDRAEIKLYQGVLKAKLGSLATANKPNAFAILTPRGRITLTDAKKNSDIEVIYNNKIGLVVKAIGVLNNSKGEITLTDKQYGTVSAVIGSSPILVSTMPDVFSNPAFISTAAFFSEQVSKVSTDYSEPLMLEEENLMAADASDTSGDTNASEASDVTNLVNEEGDDDGDEDDEDEDDEDEGENNNDVDTDQESNSESDSEDSSNEDDSEDKDDSGDE